MERETYAWEIDELQDTGLKINKQGKMVSKEKKLTPQQKKAEKMQAKGSMQVGPSRIELESAL